MEPCRDRAAPGVGSVCETVGACVAVGLPKVWLAGEGLQLLSYAISFFFSHSYCSTATPSDMSHIILNTSYDLFSFSGELHQFSGIISLLLLGKMRQREGHALFQVHTSSGW